MKLNETEKLFDMNQHVKFFRRETPPSFLKNSTLQKRPPHFVAVFRRPFSAYNPIFSKRAFGVNFYSFSGGRSVRQINAIYK